MIEDASDWKPGAKIVFFVLLLIWGVAGGLEVNYFWFLNGVDLAFHEFGHIAFSVFGEFVQFLGGTLMQLLIPLAIGVHFLKKGDQYAAAVAGFWTAQNLFNIAVYVGDARAQVLPLVGGGIHDWFYLLNRVGLLEREETIAGLFRLGGWLLLLGSVYLGFRSALSDPEAWE